MLEATSQASSISPSDPSPTVTPVAVASPTPGQTISQTQDPAATPAPIVAPVPKTRPEGVPDSFWDKDKGELKTADWAKSYEELRQAKAEIDARKAQIPAQADLYKPELPKDLQIPAGLGEVNPDDPLYLAVRQMAHEEGWTQATFSRAIGEYAKIEGAKYEANQNLISQRNEMLGANGPQRVDALNKWFVSTSDEKVGYQLSQALYTPDIIKWFEGMKQRFSSQGVQKFSAIGREASEGRTDGRPDNWNDMSAMDRRHWNLQNADRKIA